MTRRGNADRRCPRCRAHASVCFCALIPRIETRTRVVLVIHHTEDRKSTNTGRLATECLVNSEVVVRGRIGAPSEALAFAPDTRPVLLFPATDAEPLGSYSPSETDDARPVTLIVPDGNWRQASRVRKRVPGLRDVPCVRLPGGEPSLYRLRFETHESGLATLEAIARALEILEGTPVRRALEVPFRAMIERTLWVRGLLPAHEIEGGLPEGAQQHDPASGLAARRR